MDSNVDTATLTVKSSRKTKYSSRKTKWRVPKALHTNMHFRLQTGSSFALNPPQVPKDISHNNMTPTISDHSGIGKTAPVCWRNGSA